MKASEERRPGITAICKKIQAKNPTWTAQKCATEAKLQWMRAYLKNKGAEA